MPRSTTLSSTTSDHPAAPSLTETVADVIRQQLICGQLRAGQHLSEAAMCEQLDISRNTLREVFRILTKEGLLHHAPNRGVSVAVPRMADIIDIYRVRRFIECPALAQAWPRHPAHQLMCQALQRARQARDAGDWQAAGTANMAFHAAIVALADSQRLSSLFANVAAELRLAFGLLDDEQYLHAPYVEQNAQILQRFEDGQPAAAAQMLQEYLVQSERMVLAVYGRCSL
ncbi:GntR family transcriptional regulator [Vandammella animalimorsus]|uniref:GntR family transcriptional regulator n=1 Tax=Vandammella animalimorsus TaxID=2029117 RepID=A0A2A2AI33_9BURK|nr:GntR family transcriptional regulator [Vandammella animalimorsus]PAT37398.1 GntR family transcriptional regulator [Vandammella animalimorsus]